MAVTFGVNIQKCSECTHNLMCSACALPNQVEEYKKHLEEYAQTIVSLDKRYNDLLESSRVTVEMLIKSRAEIIKEFAENIKANKNALFNYIYSERGFDEQIDNLVKEMAGDTE